MNLLLRIGIVFSLAFNLTFSALAATPPLVAANDNESSGALESPSGPSVQFQVSELDAADVPAALETALVGASSETRELTIVSSDEASVLAQASQSPVTLIPVGDAIKDSADEPKGLNRALKASGQYLKQAFQKDKIGFSIATFTLGTEVWRWIHVSTASHFVITSNIVYACLWSAIFVDKDTWSKATRPIQRTYRRIFGLSQLIPEHPTRQDIAMKFLAGLSLSLILNSGRAAIVGVDQLATHVFEPLKLAMPYVMGIVMTAVGFSWSELIGHIDDKVFPRAKRTTRLVMNARSVIIAWFAASAMLMNPEHYGVTPWLTVSISGITGLILYSKVRSWLPFVESRVEALGLFAPKCESLFAN